MSDRKFYIIISLMALGLLFVAYEIIVYPIMRSHYFSKETRYTISTEVVRMPGAGRAGTPTCRYSFSINNKEYTRETTLVLRENIAHYFIKYYPPNPYYNEATTFIATETDIKNMPPGGYTAIPHKLVEEEMSTLRLVTILVGTFVILFLFILYGQNKESLRKWWYLMDDKRYTVTNNLWLVTDKKKISYRYAFIINGRQYFGITKRKLNINGIYYFIKFYPANPDYNEITDITATKDDMDHLPSEGYTDLPHE